MFPTWNHLATLLGVMAIDITLAVDNAVVMGTVAAKLPVAERRRALVIGVAAAALFRILFACFALKLLTIFGLTFAGGLLLLWVAWKLWRELHHGGEPAEIGKSRSNPAILQILLADLSMSLDNTLAVAGAARNHFWIMVFGLALSVSFTGVAANLLAAAIRRYRWMSYIGLGIVLYVALSMIWEGFHQIIVSRPF